MVTDTLLAGETGAGQQGEQEQRQSEGDEREGYRPRSSNGLNFSLNLNCIAKALYGGWRVS